VYIKVGIQNQILVKVGGGFLRIEEFIAMYTEEEVDKIKRNNVSKRFHDKLEVQRIAARMSGESIETSPIRSPQRPKSSIRTSVGNSRTRTKSAMDLQERLNTSSLNIRKY